MAIRVYICPWVAIPGGYRSKAETYPNSSVTNFFPVNHTTNPPTPASNWILSVIVSNDFTAIDADATCDDLFQGDLPGTVQNRDDLLAFLRANTIGDVPVARRAAITAILDKYGIVHTDFTLATPLWRVMRRVASTLDEMDDNYASHF